jgi:hypothetical protein
VPENKRVKNNAKRKDATKECWLIAVAVLYLLR